MVESKTAEVNWDQFEKFKPYFQLDGELDPLYVEFCVMDAVEACLDGIIQPLIRSVYDSE